MRLEQHDSYLKRFDSRVVALAEWRGKPWLTLEQSAFYPTSGGQAHDTGHLRGEGGSALVVEVRIEDGRVWHRVDRNPFASGAQVEGELDWQRRYRHMQRHSGQHLLSQTLLRVDEAFKTRSVSLRGPTAGCALSDRASCRGMAHSTDLRERIINAVIHKRYTLQKAADTFDVGAATVSRYLRRYRQTGDLTPRTSPGRPSALNEYQAWVEQSLISNDLTHDQRCDLLFDEIGVRISRATRCRWVQRLGSTRKKDDLRQ